MHAHICFASSHHMDRRLLHLLETREKGKERAADFWLTREAFCREGVSQKHGMITRHFTGKGSA